MTRSGLIKELSLRHQEVLTEGEAEKAVKNMLEQMSGALARGDRIEIRGFGSFSVHYRRPRIGRNPKTGGSTHVPGKYILRFKPGKGLRDRVNEAFASGQIAV